MIANVSLSILSLEETLNTLNFANRAKNIKTNLKINVIDNVNVSNFDQIISRCLDINLQLKLITIY